MLIWSECPRRLLLCIKTEFYLGTARIMAALQVQWATKVRALVPIRNTWKLVSWLLWRTVRCLFIRMEGCPILSSLEVCSATTACGKKTLEKKLNVFFPIKPLTLTHNCPVMPFGNRKICFRGYFQFSIAQFKKYHPPGNLKFNNLGIFQSWKLQFLVEKIFPISLKL